MKIKIILVSVISILLVVTLGALIYTVVSKQKQLELLNEKITKLEKQEARVYGVTVTENVKSGEIITEDILEEITIASDKVVPDTLLIYDAAVDKIAKTDITAGSLISKDSVTEDYIKKSDRFFEVTLDELPASRRVGNYIDIRLSTQTGETYLVVPKVRIYEDLASAVKVKMDETQLDLYQAALVDRAMDPSSVLYATTYVEPALQEKAEVYYAPSKSIIATMERNPNIVELAKQELIETRDFIESGQTLPPMKSFEDPMEFFERVTTMRNERKEKLAEIAKSTTPEVKNFDDLSHVEQANEIVDEQIEEGGE